ncbi:cytochrome P450 isoform 2 [Galdieria sulphuraria]|uniref:Cytochrome P450 isoform 2 n=1 Tax=Galdieria sulphuraria TaxID=130081 RepID=M2X9R8_GALSU|nr:cytochrome P450 isoform 2 [Galdieria sulphuraria]EME26612.1 cytochrome P450 isoform 2 [Galdieria sulphuraria]|eukprot:XP_005703132.1 cytochrome P450 isoform 2 [Galdieria sulphuraria]
MVVTGGLVVYAAKSVFQLYWTRKRLRPLHGSQNLPGPSPWPIVGNCIPLSSNLYQTLYQYVEQPISLYFIASTPFVVVTDEAAVRKVLGSGMYQKPKYFGYRSSTIRYSVEMNQKLILTNEQMRQQQADSSRKALKVMIDSKVSDIIDGMIEAAEAVVHAVDGREQVENIRRKVIELNLNVLFGYKNDKDVGSLSHIIFEAGKEFILRTVNPFRIGWRWMANFRFFQYVFSLITIGRRVCQHMDSQPATWVHGWVGKVGKIGKLGKVVGLIMASSQTVPTTCLWLLFLLSKYPQVVEKIREETSRVLHSTKKQSMEEFTVDDLNELAYVDCVVKECLRLYPPFPLLQREPEMDDILENVKIPARTPVYIVPWLLHHHPKYWKQPEDFIPDRFMYNASHGDAPSDFVYIPFGRGSRMCAGYHLALLELKILTIYVCQYYDWKCSFPQGKEPAMFPSISMTPENIEIYFSIRK